MRKRCWSCDCWFWAEGEETRCPDCEQFERDRTKSCSVFPRLDENPDDDI